MAPPEDKARTAGRGGSDGDVDLVERLSADPDALRAYIDERDDEVCRLRRQKEALERFRLLAIDVAQSLVDAGGRANQSAG